MLSLPCKDKWLELERPKIMGIINLSGDSFYSGSCVHDVEGVFDKIDEMVGQGVDIIDIGGQSTRPQAAIMDAEAELKIVLPILKAVVKQYPEQIFSVDTFNPENVEAYAEAGVHIINDISGGGDKMFEVVAEHQLIYICMHIRGNIYEMHKPYAYTDLMLDLLTYFDKKKNAMLKKGVNKFIFDVGIGFSKNIEQNFEVLKKMSVLRELGVPLLVGLSRKSFIYKTLNTTPEKALNGTSALHFLALLNGANILRVHDVLEAKECVKLFYELKLNAE